MDNFTSRKTETWGAVWGRKMAAAFTICCFLLLSTTATAENSRRKLAKDLAALRQSPKSVDVIVQYRTVPDGKHFEKAKEHGAALKKRLGLIKAASYSVPAARLAKWVDEDSDIVYVTPDRAVQNSSFTAQFQAVNADIAQSYGYDGTGVTVALIDSGIGSHSDLSGRVLYSQDFTGQGTDDQYGHGTHVAGIIGGNGYRSGSGCSSCFLTYMGIAPRVGFVSLKVLDSNGGGSDSNVIAAIQRAVALKSTYNIRIINLSLGRGIYESYVSDPLTQAVEQAWNAGIFVVVAAGNYGRDNSNGRNGYGTITSPGNDPYVITVGAMRTFGTTDRADDVITSYSSKGPTFIDHVAKPDIVAAGNKVVSTLAPNASMDINYPSTQIPLTAYRTTTSTANSTYYFRLSGTSMAAPQVAGAAALMLQKNPALTPDQLKARLMKSAYKNLVLYSTSTDATTGITYFEQADMFTVGAGYLDIAAALNNTDSAPSTVGVALSPSVTINSSTGQAVLVNGSSVVWGTSVAWGTSVVWGSSVIWGTNALGQSVVWGSSVCWGSSTTQGYSVIWGTSVVWGSSMSGTSAMSVLTDGDQ